MSSVEISIYTAILSQRDSFFRTSDDKISIIMSSALKAREKTSEIFAVAPIATIVHMPIA